MKNKFLLYTLILFVLYACGSSARDWYTLVEKLPEITELPPQLIRKYESFADPRQLVIGDDYIYLADAKKEQFVHVIDKNDLSYQRSFGKKGKGPGELIALYGDIQLHDDKVWLLDCKLGKYIGYPISEKEFDEGTSFVERRIDPSLFLLSVEWLNDSTIFGHGFAEEEDMFSIVDETNTRVSSLGAIPTFGHKGMHIQLQKQIADGTFSISPDRTKVAFGYLYSDMLGIFDIPSKSGKNFKTHEDFDPLFEVEDRGDFQVMGQGGYTRLGYMDVVTTDERIYCLYSGNTCDENAKYGSKWVHIYNWDGEFIHRFELKYMTRRIAVEKDDSFLYAVQRSRTPSIAKYSLKSL